MSEDSQALHASPGCEACSQREVPGEATLGRRTPTFTATTVPSGLLSEHHTNAWAMLVVAKGSVVFTEVEPQWTATATAADPVVIVPGRTHHIEPSSDAEFWVQFYDLGHVLPDRSAPSDLPPQPGTAS